MKLSQLGEDRVVSVLTRNLPTGREVKVGVGDDCAVIASGSPKQWELLKTDSLVEGVHFTAQTDPRLVGWKALARAISDIAAMGGNPRHALITLAISPERELQYARHLYAGIKKAAKAFGVSIVGGETSRSPGPLFLSVALTGVVRKTECVLRSGGRAGDLIYVTGRLGGSIRGKHLRFIPRVKEAQWLAKNFRPSAMMDLSDGLGSDLPRLARASRTGFQLLQQALPLNPGCSIENALADGEDFELLLAIRPRKANALEQAWKAAFPKLPLTRIGQLTPFPSARPKMTGTTGTNGPHGFDHFS